MTKSGSDPENFDLMIRIRKICLSTETGETCETGKLNYEWKKCKNSNDLSFFLIIHFNNVSFS